MNNSPIKVLVTSINGYGHFNAALGVASLLLERGNDVYFANVLNHKDEVEKYGLKFIALEDYDNKFKEMETTAESKWTEIVVKSMQLRSTSPLAEDESFIAGMSMIFEELQLLNSSLQKIIDSIKPDILIGDVCFPLPLFYQSSIPSIFLFSANPLGLYSETTGFPASLGLSVHSDKSTWSGHLEKLSSKLLEVSKKYFQWYSSFGIITTSFYDSEKFLGIYIYPKALDYVELGSPPPNWIGIDSSIRTRDAKEFIVPPFSTNQTGKLIYLSMGTSGSLNISLMKRLINTFSKSKHRFIVSKGFKGDELTLPENMWGDNYVDQIAILPKVDAVITHGGNNSFVESLFFGKPMIVIPCCFDQLDNAQRIEDLKLGYRIDPFGYDEDEVHKTVDNLLENTEIRLKMEEISKQLKTSNNREVARLIENIARTKKYPIQ
ncbi:uncharacterized UDP-glucosyltransferase YojK-like [Tetranychus urticae]|uniref:UDP-glycosyltransferase 204A3 n=1 Tax=Tetranychus urticae TaxID=32264 RepID=T1K3S5_TETUR|nr:uncharacterized UDP-glucosyltransferase YojK-like [Tetranychus urticae]AHX56904.1 UDP-glycosyltransferase 204A3 [Tetranychus urticae]